ncbi:hypothetical protein PR202_ga30002 [Eleusine coracana subsp. coracana]|uniref:RNase H type-1 domain-containing protein n=1 Tax=Eleusine coracana subsp. coracana TaxID=191504 RepID=A0AAV5DNM8_ELECO|nr:hypothetical protein PR202_ga30002 [Eleusine coracana subsp. coracana]
MILASSRVIFRCAHSEEAELLAAWEGMSLALQWVANPIIIETDCLSVCRLLNCRGDKRSDLVMIAREVLQLRSELREVDVRHCKRSQNRVNHLLANKACVESFCKVWLNEPPDFVATALAIDCNRIVT